MLTKDEVYAFVAKAKDDGFEVEDALDIMLECVIRGEGTIHELLKYAKWLGYTTDKKELRKIVRTERKKRKEQQNGNGK